MTRTLFTALFLVLFLTPAIAENGSSNSLTVYDLKKDGWRVVEKQSHVEIRTSKYPYNDLKRLVQVVVHILQKAEERHKCIMEYDSQIDTILEKCIKL